MASMHEVDYQILGDDMQFVKIELDPDPTTGRRRQKWHSGYSTKREAERARVDLLSKFDRGEYVEPSRRHAGTTRCAQFGSAFACCIEIGPSALIS